MNDLFPETNKQSYSQLHTYFQQENLMLHRTSSDINYLPKVSFFGLCSKMQIIQINKLNIKTCFT